MDASAYLRNHGWRGHGHSLGHTNRGITKPLLISRKADVLGVGLNKHRAVSDQWWMRAFDQGLKSLGTGEQTALSQVQKHGVHRGGLYANFVKGERYEGSIGTSVLPTPEDSEDAVERLPTKGAIVATMSTKRKREADEEEKVRPRVKRARREQEKAERARAHVVEKRVEERRKGIEDGTYDEKAEAEKILARKREKDINKQANEFILDAQRRGIIPYGPNEIRKGLIPTGTNATVLSEPSQDLLTVLSGAGIDPTEPVKVSGSVKAQKYARMKVQREVKRSAKAYLMGESLPPLPSTKEERNRLKKQLKKRNAPTGLEAQKRAERMRAQAEKVAANVEKNRRRKATRERKQEENEVINQIIAERDAAKNMDGQKLMKAKKIDPTAFDGDADEIKLNISAKGTLRKVPGVGVVAKYPSKGEKKAKKEAAIAIKQEIGAEEMQVRIQQNRAARYDLDVAKLEQYLERAKAKGRTLSEYVKRRQEKKDEMKAEKERAKVWEMWEGDPGEIIADDSTLHKTMKIDSNPDESAENNGGEPYDELGFVVDTGGDEKFEFKVSSLKEAFANKPKPTEVIADRQVKS
jgi:nucleolar protein TMA23